MKHSITKELLSFKDEKNARFLAKLIPTLDPKTILGTKTPLLRKFAKEQFKLANYQAFLDQAPHRYFEENLVHGFLIEQISDFEKALTETDKYLPFIDNWASCDSFHPKVFAQNPPLIYKKIKIWLQSSFPYTVRFGIWCLLRDFLDTNFKLEMLELVAWIQSSEYYVQMMQARYFATALAKQPDQTLNLIKSQTLAPFVQNKTIQKARESLRIPTDLKKELLSYKL